MVKLLAIISAAPIFLCEHPLVNKGKGKGCKKYAKESSKTSVKKN